MGRYFIKTLWAKIWLKMPVLIVLLAFGISTYFWFNKKPIFVDFQALESGQLNEAQKQTISITTELNKFLVSLGTLMFGTLGFYLAKYKREIQIRLVSSAFFGALVLLGITYYYAFRVYSQLATELSQNALATIPGKSKILYYLEMEFWTALGAAFTLLFLFVYVFSITKEN